MSCGDYRAAELVLAEDQLSAKADFKHEIDLAIQEGRLLRPAETKMAAAVESSAAKSFSCTDSLDGYETGFGHTICRTEKPYMASRDVEAIPVWTA